MCGRYVFNPGNYAKFQQRFDLANRVEIEPRYNVAPGQMMPVVTKLSPNQAVMMRWGLIPFWAKDPKIGYKMINARVESIAYKPAFRKALRIQRCLVPANGFYEWKRTDGKQPYYIHRKDGELISFAGLYDIWKDAEGKEVKSFTIITTTPNPLLDKIHNRMPVILDRNDEEKWLDRGLQDLNELIKILKVHSEKNYELYPVSRQVNNATIDNENLLKKEK